jgi:hypothetical protein
VWWFDDVAAPGWHDWVGLAISIVGFGLTLVGLRVAYLQLEKTQTASEAVNRRLTEVRDKLNGDQLAAVLPQLNSIVADMDHSIDTNDREVAHRALVRFSFVATETIALLQNVVDDHSDLQLRMAATSAAALDIKGVIVSKKSTDIARIAKGVSGQMQSQTVEITGIVAGARLDVGGTTHV